MHKTIFMAAVAALAAGFTPPVYNNVYTTNGVTYAQLGGVKASNYVAVAVAPIEKPDYSVSNDTLVATIEAVAPAPGNYAVVSNKAMSAVAEAEAYTARATNALSAALAAAIPTDNAQLANGAGYVTKAVTNGLLAVETDPTVPAWAKSATQPLPPNYTTVTNKAINAVQKTGDTMSGNLTIYSGIDGVAKGVRAEYSGAFDAFTEYRGDLIARGDKHEQYYYEYYFPNKSGTLALTSDIPNISGKADKADVAAATNAVLAAVAQAVPNTVTNIVRDLSLGGIWDQELEVWWTPKMRNGGLVYVATTNVNLNAEN